MIGAKPKYPQDECIILFSFFWRVGVGGGVGVCVCVCVCGGGGGGGGGVVVRSFNLTHYSHQFVHFVPVLISEHTFCAAVTTGVCPISLFYRNTGNRLVGLSLVLDIRLI